MHSLILLIASLCAFTVLVAGAAFDSHSYPMIMANLQRNGMVNATALTNASVNVAWVFTDPDKELLRLTPVVSLADHAAYITSYSNFLYAVNTDTGKMIWQACTGKPPTFPGDPCTDSGLSGDLPYSQLTLLSNGNVLVLRASEGSFGEQMMCLDKSTGKTLWSYELPNEDTNFFSLPTVVPQATGGDVILVWTGDVRNNKMIYTVINGTSGALLVGTVIPSQRQEVFAPMVVDPSDNTVITQWDHVTLRCYNGPDFFECTGVGKFGLLTGEHIANQTMQDSWTNGMLAIDPASGNVYVTSDQLDAFAYVAATLDVQWKASTVVDATGDMGWASVCADGTIVIVDSMGALVAFNNSVARVKAPVWALSIAPGSSHGITTLTDNTFVYKEGNAVVGRRCSDGSLLWLQDFTDTDNTDDGCAAVTSEGVFANVYWPGKGTGMLVKIVS